MSLTLAAVVVLGAVVNGDFTDPLAKGWHGNAYGGGPGSVVRAEEGTNGFARLVKVRGPGATQLQMKTPPAVGAAARVRVTFRHRGADGASGFKLYRRGADGKLSPVVDRAGGTVGDYWSFKGSEQWQTFERIFRVPVRHRHDGNVAYVKFDVHGGNSPRTLEVDDITVETLGEEPKPVPPPVKVAVEMAPKDEGFGPVPFLAKPNATIADGLLLRDGKPFFWVGNGCDYGASQATSVGLSMAKLLGYTVMSLDPQGALHLKSFDGTNATIQATANLSGVSHFREAARLGFYMDFFGNGVYAWSPLHKFAEEHPDFKEVHYQHGHYISFDTGHPLGLELKSAQREAYYRYVDDVPGVTEMELCREPGPEPANERARRGFRAWAKRKYGTLAEACRVWRRTYASWDEVLPIHLEENDISGYMARILQGRKAKADFPEMHYDWLQYVQEDTAACFRAEREELRRRVPSIPVSVDVRGHGSETDGYCALDPEVIDPMMDLFSIHFGAHPFAYNGTPYHLPSLLDETSFALFSYNFFRTNTEKPIFNAEDIISSVSIPGSDGAAMAANDLGALHRGGWKFRLETAGEDGLKAGWSAKDFDDSAWDEMTVPGCWDETEKYKCKPGVAWYRKRFVARANRLDWEDGSHKFLLYGKGIAQSGTIWLNGEQVGVVHGWDTRYEFDVSSLLVYGGENELVIRVNGNGYQNGLRFYCHILANDKISRSVRFGAKQYRWMLWPYLMHGTIGCWAWSWHDDYIRPYFPSLVRKLEVASEVVLPDLRHRRGEVAYLYGYLSGRGLPCSIVGNHAPYLNWYNAIEFSGVRPDVFGERHFMDEINSGRYRLLVVPHTTYVHDETYAAFKRYVREGGLAIITPDSLRKTFTRYEPTDIDTFDRGKGRIIVVDGEPEMEKLMAILAPHLPKPQIAVTSAETRERPLIERVFAGSATRKVLYLCNWGGLDHDLTVTLPKGYETWRMTPLEGKFAQSGETYRVKVPSQDVAALLLEAPSVTARAKTEISPKWQAALDRVAKLNANVDTGRPKVLFPIHKKTVDPVGKELYPYILDRADAFGAETMSAPIDEWTPELLAKCALVVLPETNTKPFYRQGVKALLPFRRMLRDYVEKGGSLFVHVHTAFEVNNYAKVLQDITPEFGVCQAWCPPQARCAAHAGFGDPGQVLGEMDPASPVAAGVKRVQLYRLAPLGFTKGSRATAAVRIPSDAEVGAGAAAMATVELGKGRVFVSADAMAFQPTRIGEADNAALLVNVMGWLLRKDVTDADREAFRKGLFLERNVLDDDDL